MLTFYFLSNNQGFLHGVLDGRQLPVPAKYARAFYSGRLQRKDVTPDEVAWQEGARLYNGAIMARLIPRTNIVFAYPPEQADTILSPTSTVDNKNTAGPLFSNDQKSKVDAASKVVELSGLAQKNNVEAIQSMLYDYKKNVGCAKNALMVWGYSESRANDIVRGTPKSIITGRGDGSGTGEKIVLAVAEALGYEIIIDFRRKAE